jgi:chorismate-pyruvate lyase
LSSRRTLAEQERGLLVHDKDMTPRLREFHASEIDLDVAARARIGNYLVRASVLHRHTDGMPVEFGAIGIHLDILPEEAQALVLEGHVPFGAILERFRGAAFQPSARLFPHFRGSAPGRPPRGNERADAVWSLQ